MRFQRYSIKIRVIWMKSSEFKERGRIIVKIQQEPVNIWISPICLFNDMLLRKIYQPLKKSLGWLNWLLSQWNSSVWTENKKSNFHNFCHIFTIIQTSFQIRDTFAEFCVDKTKFFVSILFAIWYKQDQYPLRIYWPHSVF